MRKTTSRRSAPRRAASRRETAVRRAGPRSARDSSYLAIYAAVRRIRQGSVATYGEVAKRAGLPGRARLAGYALHALPEKTGVPWHRVVGSGGRLTLARLDPDAALLQRLLLEQEGVRFDARGRVALAHRKRPRPRARRGGS